VSKANKLYKDLMAKVQNLDEETPCASNPDFWDDDLPGVDWESRKVQTEGAKELCLLCPVMMLCAEYALAAKEPTGVWGGLTTADREKISK
jgi:hypothetical protein